MKGTKKMSKGLRNMTEQERQAAIKRRTSNVPKDPGTKKPIGGLGYLAAVDATKKKGE